MAPGGIPVTSFRPSTCFHPKKTRLSDLLKCLRTTDQGCGKLGHIRGRGMVNYGGVTNGAQWV